MSSCRMHNFAIVPHIYITMVCFTCGRLDQMQKAVRKRNIRGVLGKRAPTPLYATVLLSSLLGALWTIPYSTQWLWIIHACSVGAQVWGLSSPNVSVSSCFKGISPCQHVPHQSVLCWWVLGQRHHYKMSGDPMWFSLLCKITSTTAWEGAKDLSRNGICTECRRKVYPWSVLCERRVVRIQGMQSVLSIYSPPYNLPFKQLFYYTIGTFSLRLTKNFALSYTCLFPPSPQGQNILIAPFPSCRLGQTLTTISAFIQQCDHNSIDLGFYFLMLIFFSIHEITQLIQST